tara:strand:+ start:257 stop:601 length:345 start_codon:yes stop_codon:yes gene_type:complete
MTQNENIKLALRIPVKFFKTLIVNLLKKYTMLENAINQIAGIRNIFPDITEITIKNKNHITIFIHNEEPQAETFTNSIELLEWCEENLKSPLNNVTIKDKVRDFLNYFKKRVSK